MNSKNRHSSGKITMAPNRIEEVSVVFQKIGTGDFTKRQYDEVKRNGAELSRLVSAGYIIRTRNGDQPTDQNGNRYFRNTYRINPKVVEVLKNVRV